MLQKGWIDDYYYYYYYYYYYKCTAEKLIRPLLNPPERKNWKIVLSAHSSQILALPHVGNESIQPSKFDGLFLELFTSRDIKAQIRGEGHKRIDEDDEDRMFEFSKKRLKRRYSNLFTRSPFHCWFARASRQLLWWSRTLEPWKLYF